MKNTSTISTGCILMITLLTGIYGATTIKPARPTHYFFTPTAYLNKEFDLVASLHETSYALPGKIQFHTSFLDNVGRLCFGARYALLDNLSVGAGIAWSLASLPHEVHGVPHNSRARFGTNLTWGFVRNEIFEAALTPHMQLGDTISAGGDYGMMITPSEYWSVIGEFGFSFDFSHDIPYLNTIWGARIHPPQLPYLFFDGGVDFVESPAEHFARNFAPFIDVVFTMKTMW